MNPLWLSLICSQFLGASELFSLRNGIKEKAIPLDSYRRILFSKCWKFGNCSSFPVGRTNRIWRSDQDLEISWKAKKAG